jgi:hypothetical protein
MAKRKPPQDPPTTQFGLPLGSAFDPKLGELLKALGMGRAAERNKAALALAKAYVERAARQRVDRTATADDAAAGFEMDGFPPNILGNAAGSLFKGKQWRFTGRWQASKRATNHRHQNRVWELVGP